MKNVSTADASTRRISVIRWIGKDSPSMNEQTHTKITLSNLKENSSAKISSPYSVVSEKKNENEYSCLFCGKSFKWHSHLVTHERIHTGERPFKCEICGKAFARSDGLQCHKIAVHTTTLDSCPLHEGDDRYNKPFVQPDMIKLHAVQSALLQCHLCSRKCYSYAGMMKHMQKHKGGIHFKCEVCNKKFTKRSALEIHSRVHTGVRPYPCDICTKAFSIHGNLKRHLLIHTGEKPYKCLRCSNSFNNASHLKRHIKTKHSHRAE